MNCSAMERAIGTIEIGNGSNEGQELVLARKFPTVEVRVRRNLCHHRAIWWTRRTERELLSSDRGAEIRVATEEFDFVLRHGRGSDAQHGREENKKLGEQQRRNT